MAVSMFYGQIEQKPLFIKGLRLRILKIYSASTEALLPTLLYL